MTDDVKKFAAPGEGGAQLNVILTIGHSAIVDQIQSFIANDIFETIFQPQTAENFNSMNLICICKDLHCKLYSENNKNPYDNNSVITIHDFIIA